MRFDKGNSLCSRWLAVIETMKNILLRHSTRIITGAILLILITSIYFSVGFIDSDNQEPRDPFYVALDQGALFWSTLTFILTLLILAFFKIEKYLICFLFVFGWIISALILYVSLSDLEPFYTDIAIYQNKKQENVIIQYFETGITGNPGNRLIKTNNINAGIRNYEEIYDAPVLDTLFLYEFDDHKTIPKVLIIKNDTFHLQKIHNR
ncbi:hypothetical protein HUW51_09055 [Adhaeribacter swui]|uniref:Uncharacterized protein n=1 Tax=Adhaeribacter swui TaxID=2086471 RepID=A0A7G7G6T8_9BACT|nr:hypothetical protein [Adhaeribacter swui]QNF32872.1 hypothetical protein HUW51_09055 [Adhaeribacter swui]